MYNIATLNKISKVGLANLDSKYIITEAVNEADGILVRSQDMLEMEFSQNLKSIARAGAGVNNIPLDRCAQEGIVVFNTPGANANAVKELVICGLLMAMRNVPQGMAWANGLAPTEDKDVAKQVEKGKSQFAGNEICGKTLAVVGLGAIGRKVAEAARALGMKTIGYDPFVTELEGVEVYTDLKEMVAKAGIVTLHLPANDKTKKMINKEVFDAMQDGTVLLNFSRDKLVNEADLFAALAAGKVGKYVCDFPTDNMVGQENVILIPHLGASTEEAEDNCATMAVLETRDFLENGNIKNSVNFPAVDMGENQGSRLGLILNGVEDPKAKIAEVLAAANVQVGEIKEAVRKDGIAYVLVELKDEKADAIIFEGEFGQKIIKKFSFNK